MTDEILIIVGSAGLAIGRWFGAPGEPTIAVIAPDAIPTWADLFDALKVRGFDSAPVIRVRHVAYQQALLETQHAGGSGRAH